MAREFSKGFYESPRWKRTRAAYIKQYGYLCEMCKSEGKRKPGKILHHKEELSPNNINEAEVSIAFDNLIFLCDTCHKKVHGQIGEVIREGYTFDEQGNIVTK